MRANITKSFRFKQFLVHQENCAMRVNTDGCLLAAWAHSFGENILDVGCGSGVISLMLAQRNPSAQINAIDIDPPSCADATINFQSSPWHDRLEVICGNYIEWSFDRKFDLIISNPPFFSHGIKPPSAGRRVSRHTESLSSKDFLNKSVTHLTKNGRITIILPFQEFKEWEQCACDHGLAIGRLCRVCPDTEKPVHRIMAEFGYGMKRTEEELHIRNSRQEYSPEFISLLRDFYLHF